MQELELVSSLLSAWESAVVETGNRNPLDGHLARIQGFAPIDSLILQLVDANSKGLKVVLVAGGGAGQSALDATLICSDAKWLSVNDWCRSGVLIQQAGSKRTGKLNTLTPDAIQNEVFAIPLRPTRDACSDVDVPVGAAVFEIASNRSLREEHFRWFERWSPILWLVLERAVGRRWPELLGDAPVASSNAVSSGPTDEAREAIVGSETGLRAVMERVRVVAPSDMPVLILGETGTGKEVVARAIHGRSPRSAKPFIRVNCGAIPTELIDSQLFGHERGSFTGASDQRKGWFERADGGTLFLDEIGELPLAAQVRLLRVLQDHQIERVGGQEHIHVDVRIVAATHRDLSAMVHSRSFREDLWYRVNMFPILLPGLRERVEDIPSLARHFAKRAADRFGLPYVEPSLADIKQLMDYRWPGNIRELQAVMDRAVILGGGLRLDVAMSLGNAFIQPPVSFPSSDEPTFYEVIPESTVLSSPTSHTSSSVEDLGPVDSLNSAIVRHIERALAATNGQVEGNRGAAQLLGINPHTLRAKMRKLAIDWDRFRR
ncbi:MAG: sigma-54 dependent transcriptional regulator [Planctomycetota bacterium]|nr:sigma-54 dependent transcriptional regulator [Planctomycetota bacterium]